MRELTELSRDIFGGRDPDSIRNSPAPNSQRHRNHTANPGRHISCRHPTCPINTRHTSPVNHDWCSLPKNHSSTRSRPISTTATIPPAASVSSQDEHCTSAWTRTRLPLHHGLLLLTRIPWQVKSFWLADRHGDDTACEYTDQVLLTGWAGALCVLVRRSSCSCYALPITPRHT